MPRRLKVQEQEIAPAKNANLGYRKVPVLKLSGNWLAEAGFKPGDHVLVIVTPTGLRIQLG